MWQRCDLAGDNCVAIPGATGTTYTLTGDDVDATIRALVTASNAGGVAGASSVPSATVTIDPPSNTVAPVITGDLVDGETLTTDDGGWTGTQPLLFTYQWQRCDELGNNCVNLPGATDPAYTLTGDDVGVVVRVLVTAANDAGTASAASSAGAPVAPTPPVNVVAPTVTGATESGEILTAHDGDWTGSHPMTNAYQWERCTMPATACADIAGATDPNYTLTDDDAGHTVRVEVSYSNAAGSDAATSTPTAVVDGDAPADTTGPSLSGSTRDGETLTLDDGVWTGTPTVTYGYQWQRCDEAGSNCADVAGATGLTYDLHGADVGSTVQAVVTATNAYGDHSASTPVSAVVTAAPPAETIAPAVVGTAIDGQTVTADPGIWSGTAPVTYEYQWLRCDLDGTSCAAIPGATDDEYTLTSADAGHGIKVEVTATNAAGSATGTSPLAAVNAAAPQNTSPPTVSGSYVDGHTLTAGDGTWSGTTPLTFDHQWLRCEADGTNCALIPGETGTTYTLTGDDVGHHVVVSVHASNSAGDAQAVSAPAGGGPSAPTRRSPRPRRSSRARPRTAPRSPPARAAGPAPSRSASPTSGSAATEARTACEDIAGATDPTYTLTAGDIAGTVRVDRHREQRRGRRHEHLRPDRHRRRRAARRARRRPPSPARPSTATR